MESIEERMRKQLHNSGLFAKDIDAIIERVKAAPENKVMAQRWNDSVGEYPPALINIAWFTVKTHTLEYIDENCPQAWFRPLFVSESQVTNTPKAAHSDDEPESILQP